MARSKSKKTEKMASRADRHALYEASVQNAEDETKLIVELFERVRGRKPRSLREDFCGTAVAACEWVRANRLHHAYGVDLDESVLEWGRKNNVSKLNAGEQRRLEILQSDVLEVKTPPVDIVTAFNFSYWVFKRRDLLRHYFASVREALVDDGVFFFDVFGGSDAQVEGEESTKMDGFTYIWDQAKFDPVTGDYRCHIHFKFPDGSQIRKAFTYEWRMWTLPELREIALEAGFSRATVYWEGTDEDGDGNGEYEPAEHGEADPAWIVYIMAEK